MGYQFYLPMVLRWRASRAEAPLTKFSTQQLISNYPNCTCINQKLNGNQPTPPTVTTQTGITPKGIALKGITQKGITQKGITQKGITRKVLHLLKGITRKGITQTGIT